LPAFWVGKAAISQAERPAELDARRCDERFETCAPSYSSDPRPMVERLAEFAQIGPAAACRAALEVFALVHHGPIDALIRLCSLDYAALRVAVGTTIARRPPHRTRRAQLPHRAPTLGHDASHPFPCQPADLATPPERAPPVPRDIVRASTTRHCNRMS
jgi:hypothetical protein